MEVDVNGDEVAVTRPAFYNTPINLDELTKFMEFYNDCHRHMLQYLLRRKGIVTTRQFYVELIRFYTTMKGRNPLTVQYVDSSRDQLMYLTKKVIKRMSKELRWLKIQVQTICREETGVEYVSLMNQHSYQGDLVNISGLKKDEVYLFTQCLNEIFTDVNNAEGTFTLQFAIETARNLPNPISTSKIQEVLEKLVNNKWLTEENGEYELEPRAICELEAVLRAKYHAPTCELCNRIVVRKILSIKCPSCEIFMHNYCFTVYFERMAAENPQTRNKICCPRKTSGCTETFEKPDHPDDVQDEELVNDSEEDIGRQSEESFDEDAMED